MHPRAVALRIERLRGFRNRKPPDLTPTRQLAALAADAAKRVRDVRAIDRAWADAAPPGLATLAEVSGLSRGVLTLKASDASARYEIDWWLRSGGERRLIARSAAPISRVKLV